MIFDEFSLTFTAEYDILKAEFENQSQIGVENGITFVSQSVVWI